MASLKLVVVVELLKVLPIVVPCCVEAIASMSESAFPFFSTAPPGLKATLEKRLVFPMNESEPAIVLLPAGMGRDLPMFSAPAL
jgi:hypothetical protein